MTADLVEYDVGVLAYSSCVVQSSLWSLEER